MRRDFDRRDFHRLTAAALGGLAAGVSGCGERGRPAGDVAVAKADVHLCRGLNDCKGQGKDGKNDCRGQGTCATAKENTCGGQNDCKGLGGCGGKEGAKEWKGQGGCQVRLMTGAWETLRKRKEGEWGEKKLEFGSAPAVPKAS